VLVGLRAAGLVLVGLALVRIRAAVIRSAELVLVGLKAAAGSVVRIQKNLVFVSNSSRPCRYKY